MVGSSNSNNRVTSYQKFISRFISIDMSNESRRLSSRFRGVLPLENHKWGARISFKYKAHWLGTYRLEEEAAMAYDRAALKLQKTETPLNLPFIIHTPREKSFQSWYSEEEVLNMIKDKTYSFHFTSFLAHQSLSRKTLPGSLINSRGLSYKLLFHKELKQTDVVTNTKGFQIPKQYALQCFPPLGPISENGVRKGGRPIDITFYDRNYVSWILRYSYWASIKAFMFTTGWRHFVAKNNLKSGDTIAFFGCYHVDRAGVRRVFYMIDIHRHVPGNYIVGNGGEQGFGPYGDGMEGDDTNKGVKLFGVVIG